MNIRKLDVHRRFSNGSKQHVGQLAQNHQGIFFQYSEDYLNQFSSLSPFKLPFNSQLHKAPVAYHNGLHGVFADSLPDGWGLLLMDRVFRQNGILPHQVTPLDRLAYIGQRGMGCLSYTPVSDYTSGNDQQLQDISLLGQEAQRIFEGQTEDVLAAIANAGGSGGARPKAMIYLDPDKSEQVSIDPESGLTPWLIKFTSKNLPLAHEEGLCEAAWLAMAKQANISVPKWLLVDKTGHPDIKGWLALKRFDGSDKCSTGRFHMHTLCGLLDADFRQPSMDYEDLIKVSQVLCKSPAAAQEIFKRALFNLFSLNQDDHTKNWSFLMDDDGQWSVAPFYDVTFSPSPHNQHTTAFCGYGNQPPLKIIQRLAKQANFSNWNQAKQTIEYVVDALSQWPEHAKAFGIKHSTQRLINKQLNEIWHQNKHLFQ